MDEEERQEQEKKDREHVKAIYDYYMKRKGSLWTSAGFVSWIINTLKEVENVEDRKERQRRISKK